MQRPENFRINHSHSLARGLVFAGLGASYGTTHYHDSSLHGNAGTLTNMTPADDWVWVDELGRWGLDFDGVNNYAVLPDFAILPALFANAITTSFWIRTTQTSLVQIGNYDGIYDQSLQININRGASFPLTGRLFFFSRDGTGKTFTAYHNSDSGVIDGEWHHIAFAANLAAGSIQITVDGRSVSVDSTDANTPFSWVTNFDYPFFLGASNNVGTPGYQLTGGITDFSVHGRLLAAPEIAVLANPADPMLGGLVLPPKRKYYGIPYIRPGYRYKLGRLLLQRT